MEPERQFIDPIVSHYLPILSSALPILRVRYGVQRLWLYGPHTRGKTATGVPLDILADISGTLTYADFLALQASLGQLLGIPVELVLKGSMAPDVAEIVIPDMIAIDDSQSQ